MLLFFHGLDSDNETTKFSVISHPQKICETVNYRSSSYDEISYHYDQLIHKYKPSLLIGHSLGGYWALLKSEQHSLPCVLINPQLYPSFRTDYPDIDLENYSMEISRYVYLEMGDEVLDIDRIYHALKDKTKKINIFNGGHHRVAQLHNVDKIVTLALNEIITSRNKK